MALRIKPLPENPDIEMQRKLLTRPETNPTGHVPFEDARKFPFEPRPDKPSRVNAWWLAEASWLAYMHGEDDVKRVFRDQAGMDCRLVAADDTETYLAHNADFAILAIRGTQPDRWGDIFDDAKFIAEPWLVGHVHRGFQAAFRVVEEPLNRAFADLPAQVPIWFTGHSLGAAVATLAAYRYRERAGGVYTFGSPLVGNGIFAGTFDSTFQDRSIRYVHDHDVVTRVPPEPFALPHGRFTHVDQLRWINRDGQIGTTPPTIPHFVRDIFGRANALLDVIDVHRQGPSVQLPAALTDHTPLYYALHVWNDFARHTT